MDAIIAAFASVLNVQVLLLILVGTFVGIIFGAIPGLNTPIAVALLLPFSYKFDTISAMALLLGVYMGGISGGLVSAILLRIPGTAAAIATTFDGYPMCRKGKGAEALAIGTYGSFLGGAFSAVVLAFLAKPLTQLCIRFGPWDYFGLTAFALSLVSVLVGKNVLKGYISMLIGLFISCIGLSSLDGIVKRFTMGNYRLEAGVSMVILIIGIYAIPEILSAAGKLREDLVTAEFEKKRFYLPAKENRSSRFWPLILQSSIIGTFIGILPGLGSSTGAMLSYTAAQKTFKSKEGYGTGCPEGIYASEVSNNAVTGGALIPMLALGIPGDSVTAIIMAALILQGISVGPLLFVTNASLIHVIVLIVFLANLAMFILQSFGIPFFARIVQVPRHILLPLIMMCIAIGCISVNNRLFDFYVVIVLGLLGYALEKNGYPLPPLLLGFILGSGMELYLRRSLMYYGSFGNCMRMFSAGTVLVIAAVLLTVVALIVKNPRIMAKLRGKKAAK
ncbi:MAG: tripartite tricarboxylate transporter permease [Candidatus Ventricola sp.]